MEELFSTKAFWLYWVWNIAGVLSLISLSLTERWIRQGHLQTLVILICFIPGLNMLVSLLLFILAVIIRYEHWADTVRWESTHHKSGDQDDTSRK